MRVLDIPWDRGTALQKSGTAPEGHSTQAKGQGDGRNTRTLPILGLLLGLMILVAPIATDLYAQWKNTRVISGMTSVANDENDPARLELLANAYKYNSVLAGVPYEGMKGSATEELAKDREARGEDGSVPDVGGEPAGNLGYADQLNYDGVAMSWIEIPKIGVKLPVFHGTSDDALSSGAGHLEGSSLPVGGLSTHTVITAHSGSHAQRMFDDIRRLEPGDIFVVHTLGTSYAYMVYSTEVVLPDERASLSIQQGEDLCTLVTCTPYGVNDHRLLVHARRTTKLPGAPSASDVAEGIIGIRTLPFAIATAIAAVLVIRRHRSRGHAHGNGQTHDGTHLA